MAGIFGGECPVCTAKDAHIAFLESQVRDLQAKLLEIAAPGGNARIAWTPPKPREAATRPASHNPGRLGQLRADRPKPKGPEDTPTPNEVTAHEIEARFRQ